MLGKLTIDKASMNISFFLYSVKLINDHGGKIDRASFIREMAEFAGLPYETNDGKENRTPYNKTKLPRYFGFIDLYKDSNKIQYLVLTQRGLNLTKIISEHDNVTDAKKRFYIKKEDRLTFTNMFLESVLFDSFGKNNCGAEESKTDVEPPKIAFKTIALLGKATVAEINYVMYSMNQGVHKSFEEALLKVRERRTTSQNDYTNIFEKWGLINKAGDCKVVNIFTDENIQLFLTEKDEETGQTFYLLNPATTQHYKTEIETLSPVYSPIQMTISSKNQGAAEQWVNDTILGRMSDKSFICKVELEEETTNQEFVEDIFLATVAKAYNNESTNVYLLVKNCTTTNFIELLGKYAQLLERKLDFTVDDHGFSTEAIIDKQGYDFLVSNSREAKRKLDVNKVLVPSNFHIITIERENEFMDKKFDYTFKQCFVENETKIPEETIGDKEIELFANRSARKNTNIPLNVILYGAPGTGKTYSTAVYALSIVTGKNLQDFETLTREEIMKEYNSFVKDGKITFTTFHQSYGYEDFIQGLRPNPTADNISFETADGVFKKIADAAMPDINNNYVIIIDEINRANISKVFGELITLIENDKRWGEVNSLSVTLPSGDKFAIPNNLYIIGTMNSADKSISLIDTALRRRFEFIEITPDPKKIEDKTLQLVLERLNSYLFEQLESTDLLIGHAYFISKQASELCSIMNNSIIPLLYEYFYDNRKKVENLLKDVIKDLDVEIVSNKLGRVKLVNKG